MNWKLTTVIISGIILILIICAFIIKIQNDTIQRLKFIETSVVLSKDLGNDLVRSQASYVTKEDLERIIKEQDINLKEIKKDLKLLDAKAISVTIAKSTSSKVSKTNIESTETKPKPKPKPKPNPNKDNIDLNDTNNYFESEQWLALTEPFDSGKREIPFGKVGFSAWESKPWSLEIFPRTYSSTTIISTNEDGRHYTYSKFQIEVNGKKYSIPIDESKIIEEYPGEKLYFSPRFYLGIDGGIVINPPMYSELVPNITISLMSYGRTKINPTWSFLNFGVGYAVVTKTPVFLAAPINYNIGEKIPLITNFHIGPSGTIDIYGNIGLYFGGRVGF